MLLETLKTSVHLKNTIEAVFNETESPFPQNFDASKSS